MALPDDRSIPVSKFPQKVQKFVLPDAPPQLRMMLARGMVPMKPLVQVCALYQLSLSDDPQLRGACEVSLSKLPPATLRQISKEPLLPVVLDWLADRLFTDRNLLRVLLLNKRTDSETIARVARRADEETCEVIARNQTRLLESPEIIEALYLNPNTRASTSDRIIDFAARSGLNLTGIPNYKDIVAALAGETPKTEAEMAAADDAFKAAHQAGEALEEEGVGASLLEALRAKNPKPDESKTPGKNKSAAGRIRDLNIAQRIRMAMLGNRSERAILINDSNKMVSRAVITSPALSAGEVLKFAKNKALSEELIGVLANNRKWTRQYQMRLALVNNPKTPIAKAALFMQTLRNTDLRMLSKSKSVPPQVAKQAKDMLKRRLK